ncbi:RNA polymerase sigma factor [Aquimarina aquimarini]|uniref:RNA polymerase sigma factor n=1 Tax=Aquimarina aquimarini TaxID=1191734 RepID=UPI0018FF1CB4|nr:RNA polymerase sigma-70 factor [Aquimarina aquimarini]
MKQCFKDEATLMLFLKKGDEKAYNYLIDTYHHKLCVYADSLINDTMKSQDIVQNVFIKIWEKRKLLNINFSLQNYLYRLTYNEFIDQYRKTKAVTKIEKKYIEYLNSFVEKEDPEMMEKLINLVKHAIQELPPKCKQIFELSKKEGLTNLEISNHLNINIKTVEAHITKAFSLIRKRLKGKINTILFLLFDWKKMRHRVFG